MPSRPDRRLVRCAAAGLALLASAVLVACDRDPSDDRQVVEVFGPIVGPPGERLGAALRTASEGSSVELRYVGVTSFNEQLDDRLDRGDRPGVVLLPQPGLLVDLIERGVAEPLPTDVATTVEASFPAGLVDVVRVDGVPAAVWLTVDVKGLVWYRPAEFAARGLTIPSTLDELSAVSEAVRTDGERFAPWCVAIEAGASTGWVGTDWVETYVLRRLGPDAYDRWTSGELEFDSPEMRSIFDELDALLRSPGAIAGGVRSVLATPWERVADQMLDDPAPCLMTGQADFLRRDLPTGTPIGPDQAVDFFVVPPLEANEPVPLVLGGTLATPLDTSAPTAEAMEILAGAELAQLLSDTPDFLSPHTDVDVADDPGLERLADLLREAPAVRFDGSDVMPPAVGSGTFWAGMRSFFASEDVAAVLTEIEAGWTDSSGD